MGMDRTTQKAEIVRADGAPTKNNYLMQFQSDIARCKVEVSEQEELSGIGVAVMAGIALAIWDESVLDHISRKCYGMCMEEECAEKNI